MPAVFRFEDRPSDPFGATTPCEDARVEWIASRDRHVNFATFWKMPRCHVRFDKKYSAAQTLNRSGRRRVPGGLRLRHPRPNPAPRAHPPPVVHAKSSPTTSTWHVPANRPSFRLSASSPARAHRTALSVSSAPPRRHAPERLRGDLGVARDAQPAQRAAPLRQRLDALDAHERVHAQVDLEERAAPARHGGERCVVQRVAPAEQQRPQARRAPRVARERRDAFSRNGGPPHVEAREVDAPRGDSGQHVVVHLRRCAGS
jgi:hypothetical protein